MNKDDLRDVVAHLEALESLTKLFSNLWFDHIKGDIKDEKVKAYLMVFDDAFPGIDHVVEFVRKNANAFSSGDEVQDGFAMLSQSLLNREIETDLDFDDEVGPESYGEEDLKEEKIDEELIIDQQEALETIVQEDIDALFVEKSADAAEDEELDGVEEGLAEDVGDVLVEEEVGDEADLEDILGDDEEADEESDEVLLGGGEKEEEGERTQDYLEDLLGDEDSSKVVDDEEEIDLEDILGDDEDEDDKAADDFADLLADGGEVEAGEEDVSEDLGDLLDIDEEDRGDETEILDEVEEEEEQLDIAELLDDEEDVGDDEDDAVKADISEEEMTALLGDDEEGQEMAQHQTRTKTKAKAKKAESAEMELDDARNGEESIGQDEIDALFG